MVKFTDSLKKIFKRSVNKGILMGVIALVTSFLISFSKVRFISRFFSIVQIREMISKYAILPVFGNRAIDFFENISIMQNDIALLIFIAIIVILVTVLIMFIGNLIYTYWIPQIGPIGRNRVITLIFNIFTGSLFGFLILWILSGIPFIVLAFSMLVYYGIIALIMGLLAKWRMIRVE